MSVPLAHASLKATETASPPLVDTVVCQSLISSKFSNQGKKIIHNEFTKPSKLMIIAILHVRRALLLRRMWKNSMRKAIMEVSS
jgi:hypothetical protein